MIRQKIREGVLARREETLDFLKDLVKVNSHSGNPEGINALGDLVSSRMPARFTREVHTDKSGVNHHLFSAPDPGGGHVAMIGHLDTVFPPQSPFSDLTVDGDRLRGPGTADMKGGIAVMVTALSILEELGHLDGIPVRCLINGDEEIGSPHSEELVRSMSAGAVCGLVFECGGLGNEVVDSRRGVLRFELKVKGIARHAGVKEGPKASALVEMAHQILDLEALNDHTRGVSINVGTVEGGKANNIVPDRAVAQFEFRFWDGEAEQQILQRISDITSRPTTQGCDVSLRTLHRRPCMIPREGSEDILSVLERAAGDLGQTVGVQKRGGASDGNFLSEAGVPVIDGLGPVGDLDHTEEEYILTESLFERIELVTLFLARLGEGGLRP